jgi:hypothetical protein
MSASVVINADAQQFSRRGPKYPHLLANFPSGRHHQQAGHDTGLMHVQPTSAFHQGLHTLASLRKRLLRRRSVTDTAMRPSRFRVRQTVVPLSGAGQSGPRDLCPHRGSQPPSNRFPRNACSTRLTRLSAAPNFHAWWCAARRMTSGPELSQYKLQVLHLVSLRGQQTTFSLAQLYRSCTEVPLSRSRPLIPARSPRQSCVVQLESPPR